MNRQEMEELYEQLRVRYETGSLTIDQCRTAMLKAKIRDAQGRFWIINPETGRWEVNAGGAWIEGTPPAEISQQQDVTQDTTDAWLEGLRTAGPNLEDQPPLSTAPSRSSLPRSPSARSRALILAALLVVFILVALALGAVLTDGFGIVDLGLW
jgi:hypothetical protein